MYAGALVMGPQHVDTVTVLIDEIAAEPAGPFLDVVIGFSRADLARHRGSFADARRRIADTIELP